MGVCGTGKSTIGRHLARALNLRFIEGDDYHPPANVAKMRGGRPLDDADRAGWLDRLAAELATTRQGGAGAVLACSALKARYRDRLLAGGRADSRIVFLDAPRDLLLARLQARPGHFMPASLLDSQFASLEAPPDAITPDATAPPATVVAEILASLDRLGPAPSRFD